MRKLQKSVLKITRPLKRPQLLKGKNVVQCSWLLITGNKSLTISILLLVRMQKASKQKFNDRTDENTLNP